MRRRTSTFRIARATRSLDAMLDFYSGGVGLPEVGRFADHDGFDGVMLALPTGGELEFTCSAHERPGRPGPGDLLVLYLSDPRELARARARLRHRGYCAVVPSNPWWLTRAVTFVDPDGWRLVLCRAESPR